MKVKVTVDTIEVTPKTIAKWEKPPFQRPFRANAKVTALIERYKKQFENDGGVVPGVITLGKFQNTLYLIDGQHRIEAFKLSGVASGYADIRMVEFDSLADMGEEFVEINSRIANFRPDDILRGLEGSLATLRHLSKTGIVGYAQVRRGDRGPLVGMAAVLRMWFGASSEIPGAGASSAFEMAKKLTLDEAKRCSEFLALCQEAWGPDKEYAKLWNACNLTLVAWIYRRVVLTRYSARTTQITTEEFGKLITALSASEKYLDWLQGRMMRDRDRAPAYRRIALLLVKRYEENHNGKKFLMPAPGWVSSGGNHKGKFV